MKNKINVHYGTYSVFPLDIMLFPSSHIIFSWIYKYKYSSSRTDLNRPMCCIKLILYVSNLLREKWRIENTNLSICQSLSLAVEFLYLTNNKIGKKQKKKNQAFFL